jgi:hypothetical protein
VVVAGDTVVETLVVTLVVIVMALVVAGVVQTTLVALLLAVGHRQETMVQWQRVVTHSEIMLETEMVALVEL